VTEHPYRNLPDYQFWPRAVTWAPPGSLDPVVSTRFRVDVNDRVATIGSCFAQHLSRHLASSGLTYFVAEQAPAGTSEADAQERGFGVFSARYGNVYTVAQAVQLFRRAYGEFTPNESAWKRDDSFVDPFRPQIEPNGFATLEALERDRADHLRATRSVFEDADILVFTLGLTEAWRARDDGAVFPSAPGVAGGEYDASRYEFVNYSVDEVRDGLLTFCELARSVNPNMRILLTVSPVPLVATFENRHVLVSTTYSKAVLRVAAAEAVERFEFVDYFPSYEIIASATSMRNYYGDDLREVDPLGVAHVMRCFSRHYVDGLPWTNRVNAAATAAGQTDVICDEDAIRVAIGDGSDESPSGNGHTDWLEWGPAANGPAVRELRSEPPAAESRTPNGNKAKSPRWRKVLNRLR
jgi:hypothetical protein